MEGDQNRRKVSNLKERTTKIKIENEARGRTESIVVVIIGVVMAVAAQKNTYVNSNSATNFNIFWQFAYKSWNVLICSRIDLCVRKI